MEFLTKYVSRGLPVVFRNALSNSTGDLRHIFSKDNFLAKYGKEQVPVSTIPYARSFGKEGGLVSLEEVRERRRVKFGTTLTPNSVFASCTLPVSDSWHVVGCR